MKVKYYTCPVCKKKFKTLNGWGEHMDRFHPNDRPEDYSTSRYFYYVKTGRTHGTCRTCKGKTPWIESSMKYAQFCENPKCKEAYVKIAKTRMINKYGKPHLLNDPNIQKKMLSHRHITGYYKFQDGGSIEHVGSYEKNFLMMLDTLLQWPSNDIISPSPHIYYYDYENEVDADNNGRKFYIPDYYIPSLNLEIEIKQQTSTNQAFNEVNRVKEGMKDEIMKNNKNINYLKINDNDFREFFQLLEDMKDQDPVEAEKVATECYQLEDNKSTPALEAYKSYPSPYKIEKHWFVKSRNGETHSLVIVKGNPRKLRYRAEMLVVKDDRVFLNFRKDGYISLPGGGLEPNEDPMESAIRETQEEIRINVKNVKYVGSIVGSYNHIPTWMKLTVKKEDQWSGYYTLCFIGTYDSKYTGKIKLKDQDSLYRTGKFRKISDVYSLLDPIYQEALDKYYGNHVAKESYLEEKSDLNPACECFGNCNRLNIEKEDCIGCEHYADSNDEDLREIEVYIGIHSKNQYQLEMKENVRFSISFNPEFNDYFTFAPNSANKVGSPIVVSSPKEEVKINRYPFYQIYSYKINPKSYKPMKERAEWWIVQQQSYSGWKENIPSEDELNQYSLRMVTDILNSGKEEKPIIVLKNFLNSNRVNLIDQGNDFHIYQPIKSEGVIEQAIYSRKNRYKVFIILQHSGALLGKIVKAVTKDEFSHACISFNSKLTPIYSFGIKDNSLLKGGHGLVIQKDGPDDIFYQTHDVYYSVYVMYVSKKSYLAMQDRMQQFIDKKDVWKFDVKNLISNYLGISSEYSKKWFCSRFVAEIIGQGRQLSKVPSLHRPQDFAEFDDITLVNHGRDLKKYNYRLTEKNLKKLRDRNYEEIQPNAESIITVDNIPQLDTSGEVELLPATEGIFQLFHKREKTENDVESWKNKLFGGSGLLGNKFGMHFHGIKIKDHMIEFHGITTSTLKNRINKFYGDKSIYNIFIPEYNAFDYRKFKKKRISRSRMRIDYLYTHEFFALELVCLFRDLGKRFNDKNYLNFATALYENSWLADADNKAEVTPLLPTKRLSNLTLTLNDYQKDFIEKYPKLKAQLNLKGYILAFEQGLGKTLTAIALSECLNVEHVYIVCPNSLKENWALEIQKYYQKYNDSDLWRQEVFICSDKPMFFNRNTTKFIITNNESIEKMFPYVLTGKSMLILDESHNFRNIQSKRVAQLLQLRDLLQCEDTLIMSGTPIKATPDEIVPALMLIDPTFNIEAAKLFAKAFKLKSSFGTSLVQSRFGKIMYRKEKDVLEGKLPQKFIHYLSLSTHDKDRYLMKNVNEVVGKRFSEIFNEGYEEFRKMEKPFLEMSKKYAPSDLDFNQFKHIMTEMVKRNNEVHELDLEYAESYIQKTTTNISNKETRDQYKYYVKNYVHYQAHCLGVAFGEILPKYRRDMFNSLYDDNTKIIHDMIHDNVKKTLIFSQFKGVAEHIHTSLNQSGIKSVLITGDVKDRMSVLKAFKEDDTVRVLVATSQTIGTGVTLVEANQMFFFGPPWRDGDFQQCSDRIHRIGQTDDCNIYTVILDTSGELNLSTRMDNILSWSKQMTDSVIVKTDDTQDLDENHFEELLTASESSLIPEFLSKQEENRLELRHILHGKCFNDIACESQKDDYYRTYQATTYIPENTIIINDISCREAKQLLENAGQMLSENTNLTIEQTIQNGSGQSCIVTSKEIFPGNMLSLKLKNN